MAIAKKQKPRGRRVQSNGRSDPDAKHVRLYRWAMKSEAYRALDPFEHRLLVELYSLYNGRNNGDLFLSCREAAKRCRMGKNKANASFHRLIELGFIRRRGHEIENFNQREAYHWILTEFDFGSKAATKDFMQWQPPEKKKPRTASETNRPSSGTVSQSKPQDSNEASSIEDETAGFLRASVPDSGHSYNHTGRSKHDRSHPVST